MMVGINAGFGDALSRETCEALATVCDVVRFDALIAGPHKGPQKPVSLHVIDETMGNLVAAGLKGMPLLSFPLETDMPTHQELADRAKWIYDAWGEHLAAFSVGWEGNHRAAMFSPGTLAAYVNAVMDLDMGASVAADLTNNMHRPSLDYYAEAFRQGMQCDWLGLHDYTTTDPWHKPGRGSGWKNREEKWRNWAMLAKQYGVKLAVTEWGYHTAASNAARYLTAFGKQIDIGLKERVQYDEWQVANFVANRIKDHRDQGCVASVVFQHRDATDDPSHEGSYGLWRADSVTTKPVYQAVHDVRMEMR